MAYYQKQNRGNFKKTGRGLGSGLLMKGGSPLAEVQFPIDGNTKLRSYEGVLNKKDGTYAAANSEEAKAMLAEAKRTGNFSILEGVTNTNKVGFKADYDDEKKRPVASIAPNVANALYGRSEFDGRDVETGEFIVNDRMQEIGGQAATDLSEMLQSYNYGNVAKEDRAPLVNAQGEVIRENYLIPYADGISTTSNGEDIFTTARFDTGKDTINNSRASAMVRSRADGLRLAPSTAPNVGASNEMTRLTQQNLNFNRNYNLGRSGAFTLSDFNEKLEENPNAFYDTYKAGGGRNLDSRMRNPGNIASQLNIRDNYAHLDFQGLQQRGRYRDNYGKYTPENREQRFTNKLIKAELRKNPKFNYQRRPLLVHDKMYEGQRFNPFNVDLRTE